MTYPKAYKGVKKLFSAEILDLIASLLLLIVAVLGYIAAKSPEESDAFYASATLIAILGLAAVGMLLLSLLLQLIGIIQASKDEDEFKKAVLAILVSIVLSIVVSIFKEQFPLGESLYEALSPVISFYISAKVITGIMNLALGLEQRSMINLGKVLLVLLFIILIAQVAPQLYKLIFAKNLEETVSSAIDSGVSVVRFLRNVLNIVYLSKAKTMLEK